MGRRHIPSKPLRRRSGGTARTVLTLVVLTVRTLATLAALTVLSLPVAAQEAELRSQVRQWLETTCGLGTASAPSISAQELGASAVPLFIEAFDSGPASSALDAIRTSAERRFELITRLLADGKSFGLNEDERAALAQTPRDEFVRRAVSDFSFTYGDAALRAVSIIDGVGSRQFLQRVADDDESAHAETARALLRALLR